MVSEPRRQRLLLRCEVTVRGREVVTNTIEVGTSDVRVAWPGHAVAGEELRVVLSLQGLVPRLQLVCRVASVDPPDASRGHGASLVCEIVAASDEARDALAELAAGHADETARPYRCLLIEDNAFIRDLFSYGVRRYGVDRKRTIVVDLAEDWESACSMLERERFDMAIVDHYLPTRTGAELIERIRRDPRTSEMSVVAISVGGDEAREAAMAAGADLFLDKPIVMRDLFATLDRLATGAAA